jgi:putative DNA primase/helicase
VVGISMMPTMRPDGTILDQPGYDPKTRLLLINAVKMPPIPEKPTREDAVKALLLITDLLSEFKFVDDVARAVAVSAIVTTVLRGAFLVVPIHVTDSPVAGSGKSYLFDIVSTVVSGQRMPVISAGGSREETEKRIGAAIIAGQPLICIDNLNGDNGELGGPALSQITERPRPQVRVLGKSELVEVEAGGVTIFANGINIVIAGDITRRVIKCRIDPNMERPELREYKNDPIATVLKDRGAYIAAALTIARAYIVAGGRINSLASPRSRDGPTPCARP